MSTTPDYWALLGRLNIPSTYKINHSGWSLESHGSHTVNGVQLIPGAPGFDPKAAYSMWTTLFGVPAAAAGLTLTGTNGNDTLTGGAENDTFTGGAGADSLIGGGGNDTFNVTASDGNDTIDGGAGTGDTIVVAAGQAIVFAANDAIITGVENITLGAGASVTLTGQTEGFNITASTGNEMVVGGDGNDTITGGVGADSINAGAGTNTITDAGQGADTITHDAASSIVAIAVTGTDTVTLTASQAGATATSAAGVNTTVNASTSTAAVTLNGNTGNDALTGGSGADTLAAGAGNDTITAGAGADSITGGAGADVIDVGNSDAAVDTVVLAASADSFVGAITGTTNLSASIDVVSNLAVGDRFDLTALVPPASINGAAVTSNLAAVTTAGSWGLIRGTYVGGVFTENTGADTHTLLVYDSDGAGLSTNLGAVVLLGLFGGSAINGMVTLAAPPTSIITGTPGNDTLTGTAGDDTFEGLAGADNLSGGDGNDTFNVTSTANDANDTINGGNGTDTIAIAAGEIIVFNTNNGNINFIENIALGVGASVTLIGQLEPFNITASTGNETVVGGSGNDTITGGAGADNLNGGNGNDLFYVTDTASDGNDTIIGTTGTDTIAVAAGSSIAFSVDANITGIENISLGAGASINLNGQSDAFSVTGTTSAERIDAASGSTMMTGGGGADTLIGGMGNDFFTFANATELTQAATINGGSGSDRIIISPGSTDLILTDSDFARSSGLELLFINRTAGSHVLTLGAAASAAYTSGIQLFAGVTGSTSLTVQGSQLTSGLRISSAATDAPMTLYGGGGNDYLWGPSYTLADYFDAGAGNDTLIGGWGNDTLVGGEGIDWLTGGLDADRIVMTELAQQTDHVVVAGNGTASNSDSQTIVNATANNDDVGADTIVDFDFSSANSDWLLLNLVNATPNAWLDGTHIRMGTGSGGSSGTAAAYATNVGLIDVNANGSFSDAGDIAVTFVGTIPTQAEFISRIGYTGVFSGRSTNDVYIGTDSADSMNGGAGNDTITGGGGSDTLAGGTGSDVFVYKTATESNTSPSFDRITDLVLDGSNGDLLDFTLTGNLTVQTVSLGVLSNAVDSMSEINTYFNSTDGSAIVRFTGGGNATAILAITTNGAVLCVDVNGDGISNTSDVAILVTGVTLNNFTTACFI